jgi:hypothetical protein
MELNVKLTLFMFFCAGLAFAAGSLIAQIP